ncbi:bile acid:sodium symporter family protein [Methyloprofundus sp.]|uniref:bile acid:sodium symporter family protein n=1 Tax=Methyloprofundus sp. TaxID=2020875 RepID=UPI003D12F107
MIEIVDKVEIVFNLSMLAFIVGSMLTLGLGLTVAQIIAPFKNIRIVIRALIANFIIVPLFALGIVNWLPVTEGVRIGIILASLGGGAPFIPLIVATAKGHVGGAVGLMVLLLLVTIFFMPIAVPVMLSGVSVNAGEIAKSLVTIMLVPLLLALLINARFSGIARRIQSFTAVVTKISVVVLIISVLFLHTETILSNASVLPVIVLFFLGAMFIGYFFGGKKSHVRIIFSVGTALRNPPVAILVASQNFSSQPWLLLFPYLLRLLVH